MSRVGSTCTLCGHRGPVEHPCPEVPRHSHPPSTVVYADEDCPICEEALLAEIQKGQQP